MSFLEILGYVKEYAGPVTFLIIVLMTLIQITPIKIDPWKKIISFIGKALTKDVSKEITELKTDVNKLKDDVNTLDSKFNELESKVDYDSVISCRARIIRFGDEVSHGTNHSRNHFQMIMNDITVYDHYCATHPDFVNNMTRITSERIEEDYKERDRTDNFL